MTSVMFFDSFVVAVVVISVVELDLSLSFEFFFSQFYLHCDLTTHILRVPSSFPYHHPLVETF